MSTAALQNIWEGILAYDLSTANKRWLAEKLLEDARKEDAQSSEPYTLEELHARIEESEAQSAKGQYKPVEDVLSHLEQRLMERSVKLESA